jgi:inner membrane protein
MQQIIEGLKRSASMKALVIAVLILILLIPVSMIKSVVHDRIRVHDQARADIMRSWGGEQVLTGPILVLPYRVVHRNSYGNQVVETEFAFVLPSDLNIEIETNPEVRYRGIHKVPIYSANMSISGEFSSPDAAVLPANITQVEWQKAFVALSVSDARAIAHTPVINVGGSVSRFTSGGTIVLSDAATPIVAALDSDLENYRDGEPLRFSMDLQLNGADSLRVSPLGDTTNVRMTSSWPSPSFVGAYLPRHREIGEAGFSASWKISSLGRQLPSQWSGKAGSQSGAHQSAFGVTFYQPVSLYQQTLRAAKYAVLFIGMSFVAYFLFEVMVDLRLHPLQYLLVGFSNALFYLLLLSLAEHIGFQWAYLASAVASISLIAGYSVAVLDRRSRGLMMALVLAALYSFLYMTLRAETYALLAGALGLWATLATIMFLTRRIDWYNRGEKMKETAR